MPEIFRAGVGLYLVDRISRQLQGISRSFGALGRDAALSGASVDEAARRMQFQMERLNISQWRRAAAVRLESIRTQRSALGLKGTTPEMDRLRTQRAQLTALEQELALRESIRRSQAQQTELMQAQLDLQKSQTVAGRLGRIITPTAMIGAGAGALWGVEFLARSAMPLVQSIQQLRMIAPELSERQINAAAVRASMQAQVIAPEDVIRAVTAQARFVGGPQALQAAGPVAQAMAVLQEARGQGRRVADPAQFATALARISRVIGVDEQQVLGPLLAAGLTNPDAITSVSQLMERLGPQLKGLPTAQRLQRFQNNMAMLTYFTQMMGAQGDVSFMRLQGLINALMTPSLSGRSGISTAGAMLQRLGLDVFTRGQYFDFTQFREIIMRDIQREGGGARGQFRVAEMLAQAKIGGAGIGGAAGLLKLLTDPDFARRFGEFLRHFQDLQDPTRQLNIAMGTMQGQMDTLSTRWQTLREQLGRVEQGPMVDMLRWANSILRTGISTALRHPGITGGVEMGVATLGATSLLIGASRLLIGPIITALGGPSVIAFTILAALAAAPAGIWALMRGQPTVVPPDLKRFYEQHPEIRTTPWMRMKDMGGELAEGFLKWFQTHGGPWFGPGSLPGGPFGYTGREPWPGTKAPSADMHTHVHVAPGAVHVEFRGDLGSAEDRRRLVEGIHRALMSIGTGGGTLEPPAFHSIGTEFA